MNILLALSTPGWPEILLILVVLLLVFGAKRLPELARGLGQSLGEFRRAKNDFDREISKTADDLNSTRSEIPIREPKEKQTHQHTDA